MSDGLRKEIDESSRRIASKALKARKAWEAYLKARGEQETKDAWHLYQTSLYALWNATRNHEDIEKKAVGEATL